MSKGKNWAGQKFDKLTFLQPTSERYDNKIVWELLCDCGNIIRSIARTVVIGNRTSCGCKKRIPTPNVGQKFGRLTFISATDERGSNDGILWELECICGNIIKATASHIKLGYTKSCGCLRWEHMTIHMSEISKKTRKHHPKITSASRVWGTCYSDGCDFDTFLKLSQLPCHYCGTPPSNMWNAYSEKNNSSYTSSYQKDEGDFIYNGLDRVDSYKNHSPDNVVPCCWPCNMMKNDYTQEQFLAHNEKIHAHQQKLAQVNNAVLDANLSKTG